MQSVIMIEKIGDGANLKLAVESYGCPYLCANYILSITNVHPIRGTNLKPSTCKFGAKYKLKSLINLMESKP